MRRLEDPRREQGGRFLSNRIGKLALEQLLSGLFPGLADTDVPLWIQADNVYFTQDGIRPVGASSLYFIAPNSWNPLAVGSNAIKGLHQQQMNNGSQFLFGATNAYIYILSPAHATIDAVSPIVITGTDPWSFAQWGDWVFAAKGGNTPIVYTGIAFATVTGYPANHSAKIVRTLGPKVLVFNTYNLVGGTVFGAVNQIRGCKDDDPTVWDPLVDPTAIELTVRDFDGPMVAAEHIGRDILVYGYHGAHLVRYGGPFLITAVPAVKGIKAVSKNSIAVVGNIHYALQENGIWSTDGSSLQEVSAGRFDRYFLDSIDWVFAGDIISAVDLRRNIIRWAYRKLDATIEVMTLNYSTDAVSFMKAGFDITAFGRPAGTNSAVYGNSSGAVYQESSSVWLNGTLVTKPFPVGDGQMHTYIDVLNTKMEGSGLTVSIRFGETWDECVGASWTSLGTVSQVENHKYVSRECIFMQMKFESAGTNFKLQQVDGFGWQGGKRY